MAELNKDKIAVLVCGINGAGKSTYIQSALIPHLQQGNHDFLYINADDWQKEQFGSFQNATDTHAKAAQTWANEQREKCLDEGKSFVTETVFSHPSKLELIADAQKQDFYVSVFHIHLDSADKAINRIDNRVKEGGHAVAEDKVRARYDRLLDIVSKAAEKADHAVLIDNSSTKQCHQPILEMENGKISRVFNPLPKWVQEGYKTSVEAWKIEKIATLPSNTAYRIHEFEQLTLNYPQSDIKSSELAQIRTLGNDINQDLRELIGHPHYQDIVAILQSDLNNVPELANQLTFGVDNHTAAQEMRQSAEDAPSPRF